MSVARSVAVDHLPGNRAVAVVHGDGETILLIAKDRPAEEVAADLTDLMQQGIDSGQWTQNWSGAPSTPPQLQQAS
jgi:hypothetical protein